METVGSSVAHMIFASGSLLGRETKLPFRHEGPTPITTLPDSDKSASSQRLRDRQNLDHRARAPRRLKL